MTYQERYFRFLLHILRWWSVGLGIVSTIILACILLDWFGHAGWGCPWYAAVIAIVLLGVAIGLWKLAKFGLRTIGR